MDGSRSWCMIILIFTTIFCMLFVSTNQTLGMILALWLWPCRSFLHWSFSLPSARNTTRRLGWNGCTLGWNGYGSIPINTIFRGMNIHLPAILMFTRGTRFWHTAKWVSPWPGTSWDTSKGPFYRPALPGTPFQASQKTAGLSDWPSGSSGIGFWKVNMPSGQRFL